MDNPETLAILCT